MKRLRHWLFNFAAVVSLVLLVAAILFIGVAGRRTNWINYPRGPSTMSRVGGGMDREHVYLMFAPPTPATSDPLWPRVGSVHFAGFWYGFYITNAGPKYELTIPNWFMLLLASFLAAAWVKRRWFRRGPARTGLCQVCGPAPEGDVRDKSDM